MKQKIIQIIPCPANMIAIFEDENEKFELPILCLALIEGNDIVPVGMADDGYIYNMVDEPNFCEVVFK